MMGGGSSHDSEKPYPFVCGSHAVNTPGSGLVDFKVHVASSQDTQSALISNVELELGAPLATPKNHTPANTNAGRFMAGVSRSYDPRIGPTVYRYRPSRINHLCQKWRRYSPRESDADSLTSKQPTIKPPQDLTRAQQIRTRLVETGRQDPMGTRWVEKFAQPASGE